ncbi:MAG: efflux transporter periplasmic adaptor subunit [Alteromonadaceae bacterium]|nr:MAG: efflux transporter periplasmic adaptor subunit [Alteromonadaceae bacterium]
MFKKVIKKIVLVLTLFTIVGVFVGTAVFLYQKSQEKPVVYETTGAFLTDIIKKTVATGKVLPRKEVVIKPQVSGVIDKLYVEAGDNVKKGEVIARIQLIPDMEHLNNAESSLHKAQINLRNAKTEYERQQSLFKKQLIGEIQFNKFLLQYELQEEAVNSAQNNVELIKEGASKQSGKAANLVRSTVSGMILDVPVKEGSFVIETNTFNQGSTIANVANMKDLIFEGRLDESEVGKVKEGMPLVLHVGAIGNERFEAELEYISPKGFERQGTIKFEIRAAIKLPETGFLRAGYSANADIVLAKRENILAINEGNLILEDGVAYVEVEVGEQEFVRTIVTVGISDGINIEILSGIDIDTRFKKLIQ